MKFCVAQTRPVRGDIPANIASHRKLIELAVNNDAEVIIFPELSLTGYEPSLAKELATDINDPRLNEFQDTSDTEKITIGVGMPLNGEKGITISMIIFQPGQPRQVYSKKYLHADEEPFFVGGENSISLLPGNIALAICYEISIPEHVEKAVDNGALVYIASVAKSVSGTSKAFDILENIAAKYSMPVLMSNYIGHCDDFDCPGRTSAWDNRGACMEQLMTDSEGILIFDPGERRIIKKII